MIRTFRLYRERNTGGSRSAEGFGSVFADIIYTKYGSELQIGNILHMKEWYLPEQDREQLTRIVIVDLEKQIPDIHIFGTQYYALVDAEGKAEYITDNKITAWF